LNESFGVSVLEASASEVPVIVSKAGGLKEVAINHQTGLFVKPGSEVEIAEAISYFIEKPESIEVFGKQGRKFVDDNFNWKKNLTQIGDIYRRF
jgi:glycosyltransferase involved in cell wall biosynthesis